MFIVISMFVCGQLMAACSRYVVLLVGCICLKTGSKVQSSSANVLFIVKVTASTGNDADFDFVDCNDLHVQCLCSLGFIPEE